MEISLNSIADIVINNVYAGLKAPSNYSLSKDQVKDEIGLLRNRFVNDLRIKGILDTEGLYQQVDCIELECKDISECCDFQSGKKVLHAKIPKLLKVPGLNPVRFVGPLTKGLGDTKDFKKLFGNTYAYNKYDIVTSNAAAAWFDDSSNVWILNPPTKNLGVISLIAIFETPSDLERYACCKASEDDAYPAPGYMIDMITGKLINDYLRYYRSTNPIPNTEADIIQGQPAKK